MKDSSDLNEIIKACKKGSPEAFSRLVDMYSARCYGYFMRLTGDENISDDLLSELFLKLIEKIGSYRRGSFDGWLFTIASNLFYDYLRDKQRCQRLLDTQRNRIETSASESRPLDDETIDNLQAQLKKIDDETRQLIVLRYYSQLSFREIAEVRSEPIGTILSKVHRGLKKLRKLMQNQ